MLKKSLWIFLCSAIIMSTFVFPVSAEPVQDEIYVRINSENLDAPPPLTATAAVIYNLNSKKIIYEKNLTRIIYPASAVKIMTALVAVDIFTQSGSIDSNAVISDTVVKQTSGNRMGLKEGEIIKNSDLLAAMLISGYNDAALALAESATGTVELFVVKMNELALALGCTDTVFTNPHGMHSDNMYTTAADLVKIAEYAVSNQLIMDLSSTPKYTINPTNMNGDGYNLFNRNHFVSKAQQSRYFYSGAMGLNCGSTENAGYCLITSAVKNGVSYLCIIMGAAAEYPGIREKEVVHSFSDAKSILNWAFSIYSYKKIVTEKDIVEEVEIRLSTKRDRVTLMPDRTIEALLPQNADIDNDVKITYNIYEDKLTAPIEKGQELGNLTVTYDGEVLGTALLVSSADVEQSNVLYAIERIKGIVSTQWFMSSAVIFVILFIFYCCIVFLRSRKKVRRRFY